jgi:hypothetical protein
MHCLLLCIKLTQIPNSTGLASFVNAASTSHAPRSCSIAAAAPADGAAAALHCSPAVLHCPQVLLLLLPYAAGGAVSLGC